MTSTALRRTLALCGLTAVVLTAALWHAPTAGAHPLGNFTVNHYNGLRLYTDRLDNTAIVDRAEIAAAQEFPDVDTDHDDTTSPPERRAHARKNCSALARNLYAAVDGSRLHWRVRSSEFTYEPGEAGLPTSRLHCELTAPASLDRPAALTVKDRYDDERLGWHELTARGHGVTLHSSPVRATSVTDELRCYPDEQLAAPLDQRALTLRTTPGTGRPGSAAHTTGPTPGIAGGALPIPLLDRVTGAFTSLVGARELTVPVGLLALLLSVVLGASHAAMPGHGKTIMAAYLVGRRGNVRDAITVGATVTFTHTAGVLMLGLLLPLTTTLAGETALTYLGFISGALVTAIGICLLRDALRTRRAGHHHHDLGHHHHHHHHPGHHHHSHEAHDHADGHGPTAPPVRGTSRRGLVGMGIAGGLVPSPSALVVLLGSVALGRTAFGILLVLGYGIGMAATLMAAGIALTHLRDRFGDGVHGRLARSKSLITRATRYGPTLTATLVLTVGVGLTLRATSGPW